MTNDQLIASIDDAEYLTTSQILAVIEFAVSLAGNHPVSSVLAALHQRMAIDDAAWERTHHGEHHACH